MEQFLGFWFLGSSAMSTSAVEKTRTSSHDDKDHELAAAPQLPEDVPIAEPGHVGVARMEALYRVFGSGKGKLSLWALYISIGLIAYIYSLDGNTTYLLLPFGTSYYGKHSLLGAVQILTQIVTAIGRPYVAMIADNTSRPRTYVISLLFFMLGFIIIASSKSVEAVAAGQVFAAIGTTGIAMITDVIVADISPLKWHGLVNALPAAPYIVNAFISGYIIDAFVVADQPEKWRWGYGIFAVRPYSLAVLFYAEHKAKKGGLVNIATTKKHREAGQSYLAFILNLLIRMDAFGLILLGFAFALILMPPSLVAYADNGYKNPSLIAMFVVGGILIFAFIAWEWFFANYPLMPRYALMNPDPDVEQNFHCWVFVVKDWSVQDWTYYSNTLTVGLCFFGLVAGVIMRWTKTYKWLLLSGLALRCIAIGLNIHGRGKYATDAILVIAQIIRGIGGAFVVVTAQVAYQASVPHVDLAQCIALVNMWSYLAASVGTSIAAAIWGGEMPKKMRKYLPDAPEETITELFGSITLARDSDPTTRAGVIQAYNDTVLKMYIPSLVLTILSVGVAWYLMTEYNLDDRHNAVENKNVAGLNVIPSDENNAEGQSLPVVEKDKNRQVVA
ncbi:MFS general substrate transporter [Flagelloscypha sp. PMI_526]|nr:MFS general substrate transporter [Flagelloscypha sp. PMI_526]